MPFWRSGFNAHRALGFLPTRGANASAELGKGFNAHRALGFLPTAGELYVYTKPIVSMHIVLWGSYQQENKIVVALALMFQCTSCFGVLTNPRLNSSALSETTVSMHIVLWGSYQLGWPQEPDRAFRVSMHIVLWGSYQPS